MKQEDSGAREWLLLSYSVPREPSARRVYVWRKLKSLGAQAVQDAVWSLPSTERSREQLQWLAAEIGEMGGEAALWRATSLSAKQDAMLAKRFSGPIERAYREILSGLRKAHPDLAALSRRFQQVQAGDYFGGGLAMQVRRRLVAARGEAKI